MVGFSVMAAILPVRISEQHQPSRNNRIGDV